MIRCEKQGREKTLDVNDEVRGRRKGERERERDSGWQVGMESEPTG